MGSRRATGAFRLTLKGIMRKGRPRIYWDKLVQGIRRRGHLSQQQLAKLLNTSQPVISNWEWSVAEPQLRFKRKLEVLA